jgi:hypothetical protein
MASEALNWALANGMTQAEFDRNIFNAVLDAQQKGTSNAMLRIEMDRLGISPADVARATGVTTQSVASQYTTAVPTTEAELIANAAADAELAARTARDRTASQALIDARNLEARTSAGTLTAAQLAAANAAQLDLVRRQNEAALLLQQRNAEAARLAELARLAALQKTGGTGTGTNVTGGVTGGAGGVTGGAGGVTGGTGLLGPTGSTSVTGTTPFANATQGFEQNFRNYTSIPIGAQYNPNVVGGTGSPYAQVMGQMRPVGNPYANVMAGQAMGGYNPALYDQIAAANVARAAAANAGTTLADYYDVGGDGGDGGGGGGGGTGAGAGTGNAMAKGGYVHGGLMFGANPPGPDDGAVNLDIGEYVIKKSSVNKYGRGLLDMINEGKVPAKKMKSLLG